MAETIWWQKKISLAAKKRGFHLITADILEEMQDAPMLKTGLLQLFLQHTSASLCISENSCPEVRIDLETHFNRLIPEGKTLYSHRDEGDDDMPAHLKSALLGVSLLLPVHAGHLSLGRWQGIFLCEHRNNAPTRQIVLTLQGCN